MTFPSFLRHGARALCLLAACLVAAPAHAGFLDSLSPAQTRDLGLAQLTPQQAAAVDAAVAAYLQAQTPGWRKRPPTPPSSNTAPSRNPPWWPRH